MFNDDKNYLDLHLWAPQSAAVRAQKRRRGCTSFILLLYLITLSDQHLKLMEKKSAVAGGWSLSCTLHTARLTTLFSSLSL
jgi:hypothetical protein